MKKGYVFLTAVFIIGILVMTGGQASATWTTTPGAMTVLSNANPAQLYTALTNGDIAYTLAGAEAAALPNGSTITLTLTGGAVWAAAPAVTTNIATTTYTAISDPAGLASASWILASTPTAAFIITFATGTAATGKVNLLNATGAVDVLFSLGTASGTVITTNRSFKSVGGTYLFEVKTGIPVVNGLKESTLDVMAVPAYSKFENSSLNGGAMGAALGLNLGTNFAAGTSIPAAQIAAKKVLVTLVGDFAGITKVTMTGTGFTGCDSALATTSGIAGQYLINAAKTEAYATNPVAYAGNDCSPNFYVDGTTAQTSRYFTAKVENIVDGGSYVAYTWQSPTTNYKFLRNGTFFSANSLGTYNTVKISDLSGTVPTGGAKVLINAWDAAGVRLAEASGLTDILVQNNQTITLTGDQMAARFVGVAMKYEVAVQSKNAVISNVKKTPDGFGSNVYTNTPGGGAL